MTLVKKVLLKLKPKVTQLGLNKDELESTAALIAGNFDSEKEDEVKDEDIDVAIEAIIPYLKVSQSMANRAIENAKKNEKSKETDKEKDDDDSRSKKSGSKSPEKDDEEEPAWFKKYVKMQDERLAKLEADKVLTSRKSRLEGILKDSGVFGERELKRFAKMRFDNDEDFDTYLEEVTGDLDVEKQNNANNTLNKAVKPKGGTDTSEEHKVNPIVLDRANEAKGATAASPIQGLPIK